MFVRDFVLLFLFSVFRRSEVEIKMCNNAPLLQTLVLLLGLVFSHVACQSFLAEIETFPLLLDDNRRGLLCVVQTGTGLEEPILNAEFYLNGSDIRNSLAGSDFEMSPGQIVFNITPDLEGCYTCGNTTYISPEEDALKLVCKAIL